MCVPAATAVDLRAEHCSALVKLTANLSELFAAHVTWTEYVGMLRVYKQYDFQFVSVET